MKKITPLKRYLISSGLTFVSVFLASFAVSLQDAIVEGHITGQALLALMFGAFIVALRAIVKMAYERLSGYL